MSRASEGGLMRTRDRALAAAAAFILAFSLGGCKGITDMRGAPGDGKVVVKLSATSLAYDLGTGMPRKIAPAANPAIDRYILFGARDGAAQQSLGSFSSLGGATVNLEPGAWDFTLSAMSQGSVVLQGRLARAILTSGSTNLSFALEPLSGAVKVALSWAAADISVSVASVAASFDGAAVSPDPTIVARAIAFERAGLDAGNHLLTFRLLDARGNLLSSVSEIVRVLDNMTSSKTIDLAAGDFNGPPAAPSGLTASVVGDVEGPAVATISLSWSDDSNNEDAFEISLADGTVISRSVAAAATSYTDRAARGSALNYQIRAVNSFGDSAWTSSSATVTAPYLVGFDSRGGSAVASQEAAPGAKVAEPAPPTKDGLAFCGWYEDPAYATAWEFAVDTVSANATLYAKWGDGVVFDANGGSGSMALQSIPRGSTAALAANAFTYAGYVFAGWALSPSGAVAYADRANFAMAASGAMLYARWNANGATKSYSYTMLPGGTISVTYTGNETVVVIPRTYNGYTVTALADKAFDLKTSVTAITVPDTVTSIGTYAFNLCVSLKSILMPNSVKTIGDRAFSSCSSLESADLPASLVSLGSYAFDICPKLASMVIPSSLTSIGTCAFWECSSLDAVVVDPASRSYCSIDGVLFDISGKSLIYYPKGKAAFGYAIPGGVTSIGYYAFFDCQSLRSIVIPGSVTSIGDYAFRSCANLDSLAIPASVTSIGIYAFGECYALRAIEIPDSVLSIGDWTFSNCSSLTSITLPSSLTSLGRDCFSSCMNLGSINVDPASATFSSIDGVLYDAARKTLIRYPAGKTGESFAIPASVTSVGDSAFYSNTSLVAITIPDSVASVSAWAFTACKKLASITIPASVASLGDYAFFYDSSLASVYVNTSGVLKLGGSYVFDGCSSYPLFYVPANLLASYKSDKYWSEYASSIRAQP
jgi:uncharacterized repeat protein (TIGR02543 family)